MKYKDVRISGDAVVVAFDMCSSSDVLEELTLSGNLHRLKSFLTSLKRYLAEAQGKITFRPYQFTGDGWILLFPSESDGAELLSFLKQLCLFFQKEFRQQILRYLGTPPSLTGLTFGIEHGPLISVKMYGREEYLGRAINIACRLQSGVGDNGRSPAYGALVSNSVFAQYFSPATGFTVLRAKRTLTNIRGGAVYQCRRIDLLAEGEIKKIRVKRRKSVSN